MGFSSVFMTAPTIDEAKRIGRAIVEERLAACANCFDSIQSVYWWEGAIEQASEAGCFLKTRSELIDAVVRRIKELHSYKVPCIVSWKIETGNPEFLQWIADNTRQE